MNPIKEYIKCAYENKGVLAGYASLGAAFSVPFIGRALGVDLDLLAQEFGVVAGTCLLTTGAGINTVKWRYFADRNISENNGTFSPEFIRASQRHYCRSTGVRVSAREHGLEHLLPKKDSIF